MNDLDFTRLEEALRVVTEGNKVVRSTCSHCHGRSLTDDPKHPGYCPDCGGKAFVQEPAWQTWITTPYSKLDYWQARALVAEAKLRELEAQKVSKETDDGRRTDELRCGESTPVES